MPVPMNVPAHAGSSPVRAPLLIPMAVSLGFGTLFATRVALPLVPVNYLVPAARACREEDRALLLPVENLAEATRCARVRVAGADTLGAACAALSRRGSMRLARIS